MLCRLNQYAVRLRKMGPGDRERRLIGGLAKSLKIHNVDAANLLEPAKVASSALAVTEGLLNKGRPMGLATKICLSCHTQIPNPPKEKVYAGASFGGGYQLFVPCTLICVQKPCNGPGGPSF
jgi:hypothetical protein